MIDQKQTEYVVKQVQIAWVENTDQFEITMLGAYRNADDAWAVLNKWYDDNVVHRPFHAPKLRDDHIFLHCELMELK